MQLPVVLIGIVLFSTIEARPSHDKENGSVSVGGDNQDAGINVDGGDVSGNVDAAGDGKLGGNIHLGSEGHIHGGGSGNLGNNEDGKINVTGDDGIERHIHGHPEERVHVYYIPVEAHRHRFRVEPEGGDLHVHQNGGSHGNGRGDLYVHQNGGSHGNGRGDLDLANEVKHGDVDGIIGVGGAAENGREDLNRNVHVENNHQCDGLIPRITNKVKDGAIAFDNTVEGAADKLTGEGGLLNGVARGVLDLKKEADRGLIYGVNDIVCGATGIVDNADALLDGKEKPSSAVENAAKDAVGGVGHAGEDLTGKVSQGLGETTNDIIHDDQ